MRKTARLLMGVYLALLWPASSFAEGAPPRMVTVSAVHPPHGYVEFCTRVPDACAAKNGLQVALHMDTAHWREVNEANSLINKIIAPGEDPDLFGEAEYWTIPQTVGDCEDYVLLKKQELEALGYPSSALLITVVLDEQQKGHAVLTIATDTGDYILDNRRNEILPFTETGYQFLKRQSQVDPQRWVSVAGDM